MDEDLRRAASYLGRRDAVLRKVIEQLGASSITPHREYYRALTESIIGQQLSVKAAAAIRKRFRGLFGDKFPVPDAILQKSVEELRTAGLSAAKATYIRDLAQHIVDGKVRFDRLDQQSNQEITAELTDVKGIGEWTVQMFLMFCMGRLDVLAPGDLGIRNGIGALLDLPKIPCAQGKSDRAKTVLSEGKVSLRYIERRKTVCSRTDLVWG